MIKFYIVLFNMGIVIYFWNYWCIFIFFLYLLYIILDLLKNLIVVVVYDCQIIFVLNVDLKILYDVCYGVILVNSRIVYSIV